MIITKNEIESMVLGGAALEIRDFRTTDDFPRHEKQYVEAHAPIYAVCRVLIEDLEAVHMLEQNGFRFIETQLKLQLKMKAYDVKRYPYSYLPVETSEDLAVVLDMAGTIFSDDRFYVDPVIRSRFPKNAAGERYRKYVGKSFDTGGECVCKMVNNSTHEIVGFGTHRHINEEEVQILLGGIASPYQNAGLGPISDYLAINNLRREGVKRAHTHVSARNTAIMNLEIAGLGFKVLNSYVVLRKFYF